MAMKNNRIEVIVNVAPVGTKYQAQAQIRYIHDTVIQKVVDVKGEEWPTKEEAEANKLIIEKTIKRILAKVKNRTPNARLFKHEFNE